MTGRPPERDGRAGRPSPRAEYVVTRDVPAIGLQRGDRLVESSGRVWLVRAIPAHVLSQALAALLPS